MPLNDEVFRLGEISTTSEYKTFGQMAYIRGHCVYAHLLFVSYAGNYLLFPAALLLMTSDDNHQNGGGEGVVAVAVVVVM